MPTAHRIAGELVALGALSRPDTGEYAVGRRLWDIGLLAPMQTDLREVASPFLHDLYAATLATVHLGVREGTKVLYVNRLSGNRSVPVVSKVGSRLPLHATGVGKVLLAHAPASVQVEVLASLQRITPFTVTQPSRLKAQLDRVLFEGYATTVEEMSLGACSAAVPIRGPDETVVAALGSWCPASGGTAPGWSRRSRSPRTASDAAWGDRVATGLRGRALTEVARGLVAATGGVLRGEACGPRPRTPVARLPDRRGPRGCRP